MRLASLNDRADRAKAEAEYQAALKEMTEALGRFQSGVRFTASLRTTCSKLNILLSVV